MAVKIDPETGLGMTVPGPEETVFIGEEGYTVRPDLQKGFIQEKIRGGRDIPEQKIVKWRREEAERKLLEEQQALVPEETRTTTGITEQEAVKLGSETTVPTSPTRKYLGGTSFETLTPDYKPAITQMSGESQAAFDFRAGQVGRGVSQAQPKVAKEWLGEQAMTGIGGGEVEPKEKRAIFQPFFGKEEKVKSFILDNKDNPIIKWMATHETPQQKVHDFFATHKSPQQWLGEKIVSGKGKTKGYILEHKDSPILKWMAKTETPQTKAYKYFATHEAPQQKVHDFFATHKSPQQLVGEKITPSQLDKWGTSKVPLFVIPGGKLDIRNPLGMIKDIETARITTAPGQSSGQFFFENLARSNPITGDILKAYKGSGKETFRGFFTEGLEKAYTPAATDIAEWVTYKDTKLFAKARDKDYVYQPSSRLIGAGFGQVGKFQLYAMPAGVGTAVFASPFIEKAIVGKGALKKYVDKHPIETTALLGIGAFSMYKPVKSLVSVWGKKYIPMEGLTTTEVLAGKKTFPTAETSHLRLFKKSKYRLPGEEQLGVWHATGGELPKKFAAIAGKSELPGMYVSPAVSPYFLRASGEGGYGLMGSTFSLKSPAILRITPQEILKASAKRVKPGKFMSHQWIDDVIKGKAYVPQIKGEVEAIIPEATEMIGKGSRYYTIYKGSPVPIVEYKTVLGETITGAGKGAVTTTTKDIISTYSSVGGSKSYLLSPSSFIRGLTSYRKPSTTSYSIPPSKVSARIFKLSYKPSSILPKISKVSYKKSSKKTSYAPAKVSGISYKSNYSYKVSPPKIPKSKYPPLILPTGRPKKEGIKKVPGKFKTRYQAGYRAIILDLKSTKKTTPGVGKKFSGFETRKIVKPIKINI